MPTRGAGRRLFWAIMISLLVSIPVVFGYSSIRYRNVELTESIIVRIVWIVLSVVTSTFLIWLGMELNIIKSPTSKANL